MVNQVYDKYVKAYHARIERQVRSFFRKIRREEKRTARPINRDNENARRARQVAEGRLRPQNGLWPTWYRDALNPERLPVIPREGRYDKTADSPRRDYR